MRRVKVGGVWGGERARVGARTRTVTLEGAAFVGKHHQAQEIHASTELGSKAAHRKQLRVDNSGAGRVQMTPPHKMEKEGES